MVDPPTSRVSLGALLTLPFFAYLALSDRLPFWARLASGALGAKLLFGRGGLLQGRIQLPYGYQPRRLRGYATPFGRVTLSSSRGLAGCGCGCGGKPGGCGG